MCPFQSQDKYEDNLEARKSLTQIVDEVVDLVLALVSNRYLRQLSQQGGS